MVIGQLECHKLLGQALGRLTFWHKFLILPTFLAELCEFEAVTGPLNGPVFFPTYPLTAQRTVVTEPMLCLCHYKSTWDLLTISRSCARMVGKSSNYIAGPDITIRNSRGEIYLGSSMVEYARLNSWNFPHFYLSFANLKPWADHWMDQCFFRHTSAERRVTVVKDPWYWFRE